MDKDDTPDALHIERREDLPASAIEGTHEVIQLKRHFSIWASIGVNYSVSATPLTVGSNLALAIGVGGSPMFFYGFLFTGFFQMILCLAMAELASAMPHSSGQYSA
jgi:choline transport protein